MHHAVILSVGHDSSLVMTRSLILQAAGHTVVPAHSLPEAIAQFEQGNFDLVLLCHTMSAEHRERLTRFIRGRTPYAPVLFISKNLGESDAFADATIGGDPRHLVASVVEALTRSGKMQSQ